MVVGVAAPDTGLVTALLLALGGLIALSLILIDEIDIAYGDVYSSAVSAHGIKPSVTVRQWGLGLAVVCTALSLVLPMHNLEPFLLLLSSVFVPLYGVILGRLAFGAYAAPAPQRKVDIGAALVWVAGIAAYQAFAHWDAPWGAAVPTLVLTFGLDWLSRPKRSAGAGSA
jgi:NCS1 family nucleobase:cation symporter-1